jgi:type IV pilus assembly protein PilC
MALFKAKLRSALLLPVVTFIFFLTIMAILLAVIVPQFASVFTMMHRDLPTATKSLVMISEWVRSWYLPASIGFLGFIFYLFSCYKKNARGKRAVDQWLLRVPFIKSVIIYNSMAGFFQSIALMLQGGMPLTKAIIIAKEAIENIAIKEQITLVADRINAGDSLAQALATHDQLIGQDLLSLIKVGQETGMLTPIIYRISEVYKQRVFGMLARMNILMQPFLLIILGLMITGLIVALYTPIMSLSYAM